MSVREAFKVRTKDKKKYLRITPSGYGKSISLSTDFEKAQEFKTVEEARKSVEEYVRLHKTIRILADLEIVRFKIVDTELETYEF